MTAVSSAASSRSMDVPPPMRPMISSFIAITSSAVGYWATFGFLPFGQEAVILAVRLPGSLERGTHLRRHLRHDAHLAYLQAHHVPFADALTLRLFPGNRDDKA